MASAAQPQSQKPETGGKTNFGGAPLDKARKHYKDLGW